MDMFETFQGYFFKRKRARDNNGEENDSLRPSSSAHSSCCCCRKCDCGTSTLDLSTYVWHTEGDGVGICTSIVGDEDDCCSCQTGSGCGRKGSSFGGRHQNKCCKMAQGNVCDASTSTFDLSSYIWGTEGNMYTTDSGFDEHLHEDDSTHDLGDTDNARRHLGGVDRKRPRIAAVIGLSTRSNSIELGAPRKKKRRIGN